MHYSERIISLLRMVLFAASVCCGSVASAEIRPTFSLHLAYRASDIVVVSEGEEIDGILRVLQTLKGDLAEGATLTIPELAAYHSPEMRKVKHWPSDQAKEMTVSCSRMVLFLKKGPKRDNDHGVWEPAGFSDISVSTVWIENDKVYGIEQPRNPGPAFLTRIPYLKDEADLMSSVTLLVKSQRVLSESKGIPDLAERARALSKTLPWTTLQKETYEELGKCGQEAVSILRSLLPRDDFNHNHKHAVRAFAKAAGKSAGPELDALLKSEMAYWRETASQLKPHWYSENGYSGEAWIRYGILAAILRALADNNCEGWRETVIATRDFLCAQPALENAEGMGKVADTCDYLLTNLK